MCVSLFWNSRSVECVHFFFLLGISTWPFLLLLSIYLDSFRRTKFLLFAPNYSFIYFDIHQTVVKVSFQLL